MLLQSSQAFERVIQRHGLIDRAPPLLALASFAAAVALVVLSCERGAVASPGLSPLLALVAPPVHRTNQSEVASCYAILSVSVEGRQERRRRHHAARRLLE